MAVAMVAATTSNARVRRLMRIDASPLLFFFSGPVAGARATLPPEGSPGPPEGGSG